MESDTNVVESSKKIVSPLMDRKLTQLEEKAAVLEKDFESILKRTSEIELWAKQYEIKVNEEKRLIGLLHTLVRPGDRRATSLMNHVSVFFDEVLTRLENKGVRYNNIKFLYRDLNKPEVSSTLDTVLSDMNFTSDEVKDVRLIIELVHSRVRRKTKLMGAYELQCVETDSSFMQQEIKVFLQVRDEIDEPMRKILKKIVASCYTESQEAKGDKNNNT